MQNLNLEYSKRWLLQSNELEKTWIWHLKFYTLFLIERYDNLYAYFQVKRTFLYYITKAYIPTMLLVVFNIGSYWIPDTAEPARVTLIITTFLASILILQSVTEETVKVSYLTSMQIFLMVNIGFLVTAILQYLCILYLRARKEKVCSQNFVFFYHYL